MLAIPMLSAVTRRYALQLSPSEWSSHHDMIEHPASPIRVRCSCAARFTQMFFLSSGTVANYRTSCKGWWILWSNATCARTANIPTKGGSIVRTVFHSAAQSCSAFFTEYLPAGSWIQSTQHQFLSRVFCHEHSQ